MASIVDFFDKLERQNYGPKDSKLISTINNPGKGAKLLAEWLRDNVNTASSMYAPSYQQGEAATNLAGLAQLGSFPMAPKSAGGTLGTLTKHGAPDTEYSLAHERARKNAMVLLGLPENNTAMDRAKAMGFDVDRPVYHGTNANIDEFDLARSGEASGAEQYGSGVYTATNPQIASGYADPRKEGGNVMPLLSRANNLLDSEQEKQLTKTQIRQFLTKSPNLDDALWNYGDVGYEGKGRVLNEAINSVYDYQDDKLLNSLHPIANDFYSGEPQAFNDVAAKVLKKDGVNVGFENGERFVIPWDPKLLRSKFAAFDPRRKESRDLLASLLLPATALGYGMMPEQENASLTKWFKQ